MEDKEKIAEIKRRILEIEKKTGKKLDINDLLSFLLNSENIKNGTTKIVKTANNMLKDGTKDYTELGSKKVGNAKVDYGFRMRFLDEDKKESSEFNYIKKVKKKK
jgi:hypothetical protein